MGRGAVPKPPMIKTAGFSLLANVEIEGASPAFAAAAMAA